MFQRLQIEIHNSIRNYTCVGFNLHYNYHHCHLLHHHHYRVPKRFPEENTIIGYKHLGKFDQTFQFVCTRRNVVGINFERIGTRLDGNLCALSHLKWYVPINFSLDEGMVIGVPGCI